MTTDKALETAMSHLRSYRARQDRVVMSLDRCRRYPDKAQAIIVELFDTTLRQSWERVRAKDAALMMAHDALPAGHPARHVIEQLEFYSVEEGAHA